MRMRMRDGTHAHIDEGWFLLLRMFPESEFRVLVDRQEILGKVGARMMDDGYIWL